MFLASRIPLCAISGGVQKRTPSRCPRQKGHLLRFHTPYSLAFGRYWFKGVAIELRTILQPTSLRARWTPRRDDFRVVRDDRRLVTMGAVSKEQERTSCTLGESARGRSGRSTPDEGQKDPVLNDEALRRTCLDCAVDGMISGDDGGSGDTEGNLERGPDGGRTPEL